MILSNVELQRALERGDIRIDPRPEPLEPSSTEECPYQTTAVDLRLSNEISKPRSGIPINIDLRSGSFSELARNCYEPYTLSADQPFALAPKSFVLGRTLERVSLPIPSDPTQSCYAARIEGRSSYARCGLAVHLTAPTIHAGFEGVITLEICNFGPYTIQLYPAMYICQLIVETVQGRPFRNDSQFQGQRESGGAR